MQSVTTSRQKGAQYIVNPRQHFPPQALEVCGALKLYTVDLVIFACFIFREFLIFGLFTMFRIREFSFFLEYRYYNKKNRTILEFANLSSSRNSRKLKPREYYQIYSNQKNNYTAKHELECDDILYNQSGYGVIKYLFKIMLPKFGGIQI